jgi:hypothetical protein
MICPTLIKFYWVNKLNKKEVLQIKGASFLFSLFNQANQDNYLAGRFINGPKNIRIDRDHSESRH